MTPLRSPIYAEASNGKVTAVKKEIRINAFYMASPTQSWAGLWSHPRADGLKFNEIEFWTGLARRCESGLLVGIFLADTLGISDIYGGAGDAAIRSGAMFPSNDPMMLVSAMAAVTQVLCFGITGNTTYQPPYLLARTFSTLDHLTRGRLAWNVVTGALLSTARAMGMTQMMAHDARYDVADEYMDLVYKLWEGSWEDDAAQRDRAAGVFADPEKIRFVRHKSDHFSCEAIHLVEPSPQRTPVIFSAGASARGRAFAGKHAECTFMSTNNMEFAKRTAAAYREAAANAGRDPDSMRVFNAATVIVAQTETQAHDLVDEYQAYSSQEGNLAIFSAWTGFDLSRYAGDDPVEFVESNAIQSIVDSMRASNADRQITVGDLGRFANVGGREAFIVGSAKQVCDELVAWSEEADLDGFNLVRTVEPGGLDSFIELVVPELQARGVFKRNYGKGTMREKLFPTAGARLGADRYAGSFRGRSFSGP